MSFFRFGVSFRMIGNIWEYLKELLENKAEVLRAVRMDNAVQATENGKPDKDKEFALNGQQLTAEELSFVKLTENISFISPWGEVINVEAGGYLHITDKSKIISVDKDEFDSEYKLLK